MEGVMPYPIPTAAQIVTRIRGDLNARMGNTNALIPRSLAWVLSGAIAPALWGIYLFIDWVYRQVFPDLSDLDNLIRHARHFGIYPQSATAASGATTVTGAIGSRLANDSILEREDGREYRVTGGTGGPGGDSYVWASSGTKSVAVQAVSTGLAGNCVAGTALTLVSPPSGIVAATVAGDITGGGDDEGKASLLSRLLERIQRPPQGGCLDDYRAWIREAADAGGFVVSGAWAESWRTDTNLDPGEVSVLFVVGDGSGSGGGGYIPTAPQISAVAAYVELKAPVTAKLASTFVVGQSITLELDARLNTEYTATEAKDEIVDQLRALFLMGLDVSGVGATVPLSDIYEAIGRCESIDWFEITDVDGGGVADLAVAGYAWPTIEAVSITLTEV